MEVLKWYWHYIQSDYPRKWKLGGETLFHSTLELEQNKQEECRELGKRLSKLDPISAGYELGSTYASLIPAKMRAEYGVFYTPPNVAERLLDLVESAGVDWRTASVLDPSCGGGAFVASVANRLKKNLPASDVIASINERLQGFEIDGFSARMSQVFVEAVLLDECRSASTRLRPLVQVRNSLSEDLPHEKYDLIIGNPPYGKIKLGDAQRAQFKRSIFGHANLYGLFTDQALHLCQREGIIAYVTPTGFLAGEYFKKLRGLLAANTAPLHFEFLADRKGVFDNVLQETILSVFRKQAPVAPAKSSCLTIDSAGNCLPEDAGEFELPFDGTSPWIVPRRASEARLLGAAGHMRMRLRDLGYQIKTGPLVWNRHKDQLSKRASARALPLIWAESIKAGGQFEYTADKRNHVPFFIPKSNQEWLVTDTSCVLLQRTTAKEQSRRLQAAILPVDFLATHGGAVVENHLNMIIADGDSSIRIETVCALLNSKIIDALFRCISGSVAVSAYELAALPLPDTTQLLEFEDLILGNAPSDELEEFLQHCYHE